MSPVLAGGFLTTAPPGKSQTEFLNNTHLFLKVLEVGDFKIKVQVDLVPDEALFLACG